METNTNINVTSSFGTSAITSTTTASTVYPYTGTEQAPDGFRIVSLHYKTRTERSPDGSERKIPAKPSVAVAVPLITLTQVQPAALTAAVQEAVNDLQDRLVRSLVDSGATTISHANCDAHALSIYAQEQSTSHRLSGSTIAAWFDTAVQDKLMAVLVQALNISDSASDLDMTKLVSAISVYRTKFAELAAPKPALTQQDATNLLKALALAESDSPVKQSLSTKLDTLRKPAETFLLNI
jgi:hypothetical protein